MPEEIINRVAKSKLKIFDLEDYYPEDNYHLLDIKDWLYEGLVLREKEFRSAVDAHNWEKYKDCYVALHCSSEAIIPSWAYVLLASKVTPFAKKVYKGSLEDLRGLLYFEILEKLDYSDYRDKPVILKGCSQKPVPENAYLWAIQKLQPIAQKILYGEACSAVPIYNKRKL